MPPNGKTPTVASDLDNPAIVVDHLTKRYGDTVAVDDLSFAVRPGIVTGFLGPNGAGKTTAMRAILGLITPTAGTATVLGRAYRDLDDPTRTVGALVDGAGHHPAMTGRRALRVQAAAAGLPDARVDEVLSLVDLTGAAGRRVGGYSLGMRQRLALAGALLGDPQVLVLDEPANGLDPEGVRWIRQLLSGLADEGRTVFVSSHILAEVSKVADEVVVIHRGRLVRQCRVAELTADDHVIVKTPEADRLTFAMTIEGGRVEPVAPELRDEPVAVLRVSGLSVEEVGRLAAEHQIVLHELRQERADLEAAFLGMTTEVSEVPL